MYSPVITPELAVKIESHEALAHLSRMQGLERLPGNPMRVQITRFNQAVAFVVQGEPYFTAARVLGFGAGDEALLDDLLDWFHSNGETPHLDLTPHHSSKAFLRLLAERGLYQYNFLTFLYGVPEAADQSEPDLPPGIEMREYEGDRLEEFGQLCAEIEGWQGEPRLVRAQVIAAQFPGWKAYIAFAAGVPAAHAVLRISEGVAVMMFAETRTDQRGLGCQTALLHRRIRMAAQSGCELILCGSYPGTISQRNQMRAGLRVAYTKGLWTELHPANPQA
jgi:hypothetical protein